MEVSAWTGLTVHARVVYTCATTDKLCIIENQHCSHVLLFVWFFPLTSLLLIKLTCCLDIDTATGDRVYHPPTDSIPQDTDPTCDFCSYTTAPPDNDIRILQRTGTFA